MNRIVCKVCGRKRNADKLAKVRSILLRKTVYICKEHLTNDPKILLPTIEGESLLEFINKSDSSNQNI